MLRLSTLPILLVLVSTGPCAQAKAGDVRAAQLGSLQRTAASLDDALDVYRLALLELVPALRQVVATANQVGSSPATPVPDVAHEVFARLSASVQRRVNAGALPAVPRAYHAEVLDALDHLATAVSLSSVPAPTEELYGALQHVSGAADEVVDVFSRQRPVLTEVLDPATALDEIAEALEQLGLAEANIAAVRAHKGTSGEQLQAFLRLEIALGHALDLIAAAEESGIHVGFEMQLSTVGLSRRLTAMHAHLHDLSEVLAAMLKEPRSAGSDLQVVLLDSPKGAATVQLSWTPPMTGHGAPALLRIYRRNNLSVMGARLTASLRCEGQTPDAAAQTAQAALAPLGDTPERLVDLPAGRSTWSEALAHAPAAPPLYRLVAVTAFGIESKAQEHPALAVPPELSPPLLVRAEPVAPSVDTAAFYHDADAVTLSWRPSDSDVNGSTQAKLYAEEHSLPVLMRYDVYRLEGNEAPVAVAHVLPGVTEWVDHPPLERLKAGVRYAVAAVDAHDHQARGPNACAASNEVRLDLAPAIQEAQAGAAYLSHPTEFERQTTQTLSDPDQLKRERTAFARRPQTEQDTLLSRWWSSVPTMQRVGWLQGWPGYMSDAERAEWLKAVPHNLHSRDLPWAQASIWFAENADFKGEVDRFWRLLDDTSRKNAMLAWHTHLNRAYLAWLNERLRSADGRQKDELEQPGHVLAWWHGRDAEEQDRLQRWWDELPLTTRQTRLTAWFEALPAAAQVAVGWPDWEQLTPAEREPWLQGGYKTLPTSLWPNFLAWMHWQELDATVRARLIREQVGAADAAWSYMHFALRPIDMWLDFKLVLALLVIGLGAFSGFLLQYASRHQLGDPPEH